MKLENRVVIVTGGGTGVGRGIAEFFAAQGARVVVNYSASKEEAEAVASSLPEAIAVQANVARQSEAQALIDAALSKWGRLDVLVNNAGWSKRTPHHLLDELTDEIWDRTLDTNLRGTFYCSRAAAGPLRRQPGSSIVNIASIAPFTGEGSSIAYAASKAGVISMTKSFARVMAPDVRVNAVAPGFVRTRFAGWPEEAFKAGEQMSPLKRIATVEEVAKVALFLAVDATAITGETIVVDCGTVALRRG